MRYIIKKRTVSHDMCPFCVESFLSRTGEIFPWLYPHRPIKCLLWHLDSQRVCWTSSVDKTIFQQPATHFAFEAECHPKLIHHIFPSFLISNETKTSIALFIYFVNTKNPLKIRGFLVFCEIFNYLISIFSMIISSTGRSPGIVLVFSIAVTTSIPSVTRPNDVCLVSRKLLFAVFMKN